MMHMRVVCLSVLIALALVIGVTGKWLPFGARGQSTSSHAHSRKPPAPKGPPKGKGGFIPHQPPIPPDSKRGTRSWWWWVPALRKQHGGGPSSFSYVASRPVLKQAVDGERQQHHDGLLDMVMRKKDQFVSMVLEMEYQAQLEVAEALLFFIRRYTNGGMLPSADGTTPKLDSEQKQILVEFVPEVLKIMDRLEKSGLDDARVYLYGTEALSYDLSLKSTFHAATYIPRISRNIDFMVTKHPEVHGGAPFIVQGMMSLNAPQPLRNVRKARECFEAAHKIDPRSPRNNYFCGVAAFLHKDFKQAYDYFTTALQLTEAADNEELSDGAGGGKDEAIDAYLTTQCRRGIQLTATHLLK